MAAHQSHTCAPRWYIIVIVSRLLVANLIHRYASELVIKAYKLLLILRCGLYLIQKRSPNS